MSISQVFFFFSIFLAVISPALCPADEFTAERQEKLRQQQMQKEALEKERALMEEEKEKQRLRHGKDGRKSTRSDFTSGLTSCFPTPTIEPDNLPILPIGTTNDLYRKTGSAETARGQYVIIHGRIVDKLCVPVQNVLIQMWQTDSAGGYAETYMPTSEWDVRSENYDPNFNYSGTARTDNLGEFAFITVLPGAPGDTQAPHLNLKISHKDFATLNSMMFFSHHPRNAFDPALAALSEEERMLVMGDGRPFDYRNPQGVRVFDFTVTLDGIAPYREF